MKLLLAALITLSAVCANADIPNRPTVSATKIEASSSELIYSLLDVSPTVISTAGAKVTVLRKVKIGGVTLPTQQRGTYENAIICEQSTAPSFGGRVSVQTTCKQVTAVNMHLPNTDDLIKLQPTP
jgi:hypothetical protein